MPLYEYECTQCKRHTEKIQKFSDPEITTCPFCAGKLSRVITAPAIAFKGGGWFKDGYGNAKPASSAGESSASESGGSASPSGGSGADAGGSDAKLAADTKAAPPPSASPAPSTAAASPAPVNSASEKK